MWDFLRTFIVLEKKYNLGSFVTQFLSHLVLGLSLTLLHISFAVANVESLSTTTQGDAISMPLVSLSDEPLPSSVRGALCIVRNNDRILLVSEIVTGKLSLPGGTIDNNENPRHAAQRETWEEAGLVVNVGSELLRTRTAVFYDCDAESDVIAYKENNTGIGVELPIYFAPHYGVEVRSARFVAPNAITPSDYRYPKQWPQVVAVLYNASHQPVQYVDNLISAAPKLHQIELGWLLSAQEAVIDAPIWLRDIIIAGGRILQVLTQPLLLVSFLPLFIWLWGRYFTAQLVFAVTATSLFILVVKQGFAFPVPHAYIPSINFTERSGFSFPDLYLANWVCISSIVITQIKQRLVRVFTIVAIALMALLAFYQFISGASFLSDMLAGAILGALVSWHFIRHYLSIAVSEDYTFTKVTLWLIMTAVAGTISMIWPYPMFLSWLALTLGMLLFSIASQFCAPRSVMCLKELLCSLSITLVLLLGYFSVEAQISYSSIGSLLLHTAVLPIMVAVPALVMLVFRLRR